MKSSTVQKNSRADGRHARSERTRAAVAEAMLECIMAGSLRPTAEEIAARAGVSSRAVFRHFDNLEALLQEVAQQQIRMVTQALPPIVLAGTLEQRIDALVENSACRNEMITPFRRAAFASYGISNQFRARHAWLSGVVRKQVQKVFSSELDHLPGDKRAVRVASLRALLSFSHWNALREHEGLSKESATQSLRDTLRSVLISNGHAGFAKKNQPPS